MQDHGTVRGEAKQCRAKQLSKANFFFFFFFHRGLCHFNQNGKREAGRDEQSTKRVSNTMMYIIDRSEKRTWSSTIDHV